MKIFALLRTEFDGLQTLWSQLNKTVYQNHIIQMSKIRFTSGVALFRMKTILGPPLRFYGQKKVENELDDDIYNTFVLLVSNLRK